MIKTGPDKERYTFKVTVNSVLNCDIDTDIFIADNDVEFDNMIICKGTVFKIGTYAITGDIDYMYRIDILELTGISKLDDGKIIFKENKSSIILHKVSFDILNNKFSSLKTNAHKLKNVQAIQRKIYNKFISDLASYKSSMVASAIYFTNRDTHFIKKNQLLVFKDERIMKALLVMAIVFPMIVYLLRIYGIFLICIILLMFQSKYKNKSDIKKDEEIFLNNQISENDKRIERLMKIAFECFIAEAKNDDKPSFKVNYNKPEEVRLPVQQETETRTVEEMIQNCERVMFPIEPDKDNKNTSSGRKVISLTKKSDFK